MKSLDELYKENEKLIYYIVNGFKNYGSREDLYQAGCLGLIKAYNNYNINTNSKFSTYAYKYILGEIRSFLRKDKGIKVSREISSLNYKIEKAYSLLSQKLMREPSIKEVSHFLEIPEYLVSEAINSTNKIQSIDMPINDEGRDLTLQDVIGESKNIDELLMLKESLNSLEEDEKTIILSKYYSGYTQSEIAGELGINQVQVSRKERKVLQKLNHKMVA